MPPATVSYAAVSGASCGPMVKGSSSNSFPNLSNPGESIPEGGFAWILFILPGIR